MLARHSTFDIQKIKLQQIECRAGTTFDIRHSKVEKISLALAQALVRGVEQNKNHNGVEHFYFFFLRAWNNGLRRISTRVCCVYYGEHLGLQTLVTTVEKKNHNGVEHFYFFSYGRGTTALRRISTRVCCVYYGEHSAASWGNVSRGRILVKAGPAV